MVNNLINILKMTKIIKNLVELQNMHGYGVRAVKSKMIMKLLMRIRNNRRGATLAPCYDKKQRLDIIHCIQTTISSASMIKIKTGDLFYGFAK